MSGDPTPRTDAARPSATDPSPGPATRGVRATRVVPLPADEAWRLVTDVRNHERWIPQTRIDAPAELPVGAAFVAVSGPGATSGGAGVVDRMVVERSDPPRPAHGSTPATPGVAVYRKVGPVLLGTAEVHVRPLGPGHSALTWVEDVHVRGLPAPLTRPFVGLFLRGMLDLALRRITAELRPANRR